MSAQQLDGRNIAGMGSLTGTVTAGKPFKAAQVYIRNTDKRIMYMVYTNAGQFRARRAVSRELRSQRDAKGLKSDMQRLAIKAGDAPTSGSRSRTSPPRPRRKPTSPRISKVPRRIACSVTLDSYDNIYPPGRGREIAESTCMICHGENFLSSQPGGGGGVEHPNRQDGRQGASQPPGPVVR